MSQTHPLHPYSHAQLIANSEQILSGKYSRRLITMEKARPYDAEAAAAHHEAVGTPRWADSMFISVKFILTVTVKKVQPYDAAAAAAHHEAAGTPGWVGSLSMAVGELPRLNPPCPPLQVQNYMRLALY